MSRQRNSETWWRHITATLLEVSFGSYRRCCRDVLMGRRGYVPLRHLWVFHLRLIWDVVETYWWDVVITSPWDVVTTSNKMSWRHTSETFGDVSLRRRWVFCLRRTCDVAGTYREMSLRRRHGVLLPGGYKSRGQKSELENIALLYESREAVIKSFS